MIVRIAKMQDAGNLKEMNRALYKNMSELDNTSFKEACFNNEYIREVIISSMADFLILEEEKEIYGYAFVQARSTDDVDMLIKHNFVEVYDLYVKEEYRNKCYGKKLIEAIKDWAKVRGLEYIELNVLSNNEEALAFYDKLSFLETQKVLKMKI